MCSSILFECRTSCVVLNDIFETSLEKYGGILESNLISKLYVAGTESDITILTI